jgi:hypothetical protein
VLDRLTLQRRFGVGLAETLSELESEKHIVVNDPEKLKVLFLEMTQMCLWCAHSPINLAKKVLSQLPQGKCYSRWFARFLMALSH